MSEYPGRNVRERRSSLVKVKNHWPSVSILGEGGICYLHWLRGKRTVAGYPRRHGEKGAVSTGKVLLVPERNIRNEGKPYKFYDEMGAHV